MTMVSYKETFFFSFQPLSPARLQALRIKKMCWFSQGLGVSSVFKKSRKYSHIHNVQGCGNTTL